MATNKRSFSTEETLQPNKRPALEETTHVRYTFLLEKLGMRVNPLPGDYDEFFRVKLDDQDDMPTAEEIEDGYADYRQTFSTKGKYAIVGDLVETFPDMDFIPIAVDNRLEEGINNDKLVTAFCKEAPCEWYDVHRICFLPVEEDSFVDYKLEIIVGKELELEGGSLERILRKFLQEEETWDTEGGDPYCPDFYATYNFDFRSISLCNAEPCSV